MTRAMMIALTGLGLVACTQQGSDDADDAGNDMLTNQSQSIFRDEVRNELDEDLVDEAEPRQLVIGFPEGGSALDDAAREAIDAFLDAAIIEGSEPVRLTGHSDTVGSDEANFRAGTARAQAVADYLVSKGVDEGRITIISLGEGNPAEPNYLPDGSDNVSGQRANRRVEMFVGEKTEPHGSEDAVDDGEPTP